MPARPKRADGLLMIVAQLVVHSGDELLDDPALLGGPAVVAQLRAYLKRCGYRHGPLFRAKKNRAALDHCAIIPCERVGQGIVRGGDQLLKYIEHSYVARTQAHVVALTDRRSRSPEVRL